MRNKFGFLFMFIALTFVAISPLYAQGDRITGQEGKDKVTKGALLLDVRSVDEFNSGHVEGALNIPHTDIEARLKEIGENKDREIVVYCRSGHRAGIAKESLEKHGYKHVYNAGGFVDWPKG